MIGDLVNLLLLAPTINLLVFILRGFEALNIPGSLGFSIITLTILVKVLLWPVTVRQLVAAKKLSERMAILKPELDEIKEKFKDDKVALAEAQRGLYAKYEINPAAGCLPVIIQGLLIFPIYQVVIAFLDPAQGLERINYFLDLFKIQDRLQSLPDVYFFGIDLSAKPSDFSKVGIFVLLVPVLTGLLQFILSKMMAPVVEKETEALAEKVESKEAAEDTAAAMQKQMTYMMPIMIGFFSYSFPIGLALYWNVLNVVSLIQQYTITGWGSLAPMLRKKSHISTSSTGGIKVTVTRPASLKSLRNQSTTSGKKRSFKKPGKRK